MTEIHVERSLDDDEKTPTDEFKKIFEKIDKRADDELFRESWKVYLRVGGRFKLEGAQKSWFACDIYATMWHLSGSDVRSLKYSNLYLSDLIKICDSSVVEFFEKLAKWYNMIGANRHTLDIMEGLQATVAIAAVIFKKYLTVFRALFVQQIRSDFAHRLNTLQIFETIWILFITLRKQSFGEDFIKNYHLLLCCVDYMFHDLKRSGRGEFLNPDFITQTQNQSSSLELFCCAFEGIVVDSKHCRTHVFIPRMNSLLNGQFITAEFDLSKFCENVDSNRQKLHEVYEKLMGSRGEIDERMFMPSNISHVFNEEFDDNVVECLQMSATADGSGFSSEMFLCMNSHRCLKRLDQTRVHRRTFNDQLSYVIGEEQHHPLPLMSSQSSYKLVQLNDLMRDCLKFERHETVQVLRYCRENSTFIEDCVQRCSERVQNAVLTETKFHGTAFDSSINDSFPSRRMECESLFYRFLEKIILNELCRTSEANQSNLFDVLNTSDLIHSIYACALEILLFCYESKREFPWSLEVLRLSPVNFYKIIEVLVRADLELSYSMVKHLSKIEERVLEELAWSLDSPLWQILARQVHDIPSSDGAQLNVFAQRNSRTNQGMYFRHECNSSPLKILKIHATVRSHEAEDEAQGPSSKYSAVDPNLAAASALTPLLIFFRKLYYLAVIRLQDLCERVQMDENGRRRVWTLFEHMLRMETSLMAGRHLDQNLMCCIYVISKIVKHDITFHDIILHYRHQPQASSRVYRQVLIDSSSSLYSISEHNVSRDSEGSNSGGNSVSTPTSQVSGMGSAVTMEQHHRYEDLIKYYNHVFLNRVECFVKKLQPGISNISDSDVVLLNMPNIHCNALSPRRFVFGNITVMPMGSPGSPPTPVRPVRFPLHMGQSKVDAKYTSSLRPVYKFTQIRRDRL